jgi:hypothetical protein
VGHHARRHRVAARQAGAEADAGPEADAEGAKKSNASLRDLLDEWIRDDTTTQAAQTKKVYRASVARLLDCLESQGLPLIGASLTPAQVNAFLNSSEAARRGPARNSIRVWCEWLEWRKVIAKNPLPLGGG